MKAFFLSRCAFSISLAAVVLAGCGGGATSLLQAGSFSKHRHTGTTPIQHVVLIVQENRSFDNLFATFPGANGATRGQEKLKKKGKYYDKWVKLKSEPLAENKYDLSHCRPAYITDLDGGKMDGFNIPASTSCGPGKPAGAKPYQYAALSDVAPYWDIAHEWVLADAMFQTQGSGSFTAHQDLIRGGTCVQACKTPSGTTRSLVDNPTYWPWGCDAPASVVTDEVDIYGTYYKDGGPYPCSNKFPVYGTSTGYATLGTLLDAANVTWRYYTPCFNAKLQQGCSPSSDCQGSNTKTPNCNGSLLDAFDVIYPVRNSSEWGTNVSWPETNIFTDITNGTLPAVSWVIPEDANSDHPDQPCSCDDGPSWVASVVNAIGQSSYWNSTVVIVVWDDWGGFYDNAVPPFYDDFGGLGFRVPMLVVSPYAVAGSGSQGGYISHTQYEFGSILKYIEGNWNLGNLGTSDVRATSIGDVLNYDQSPRSFTAIPSKRSVQFFISHSRAIQHGDPD